MRKRITAIALSIAMLICCLLQCSMSVLAFDTQTHNAKLREVLFGKNSTVQNTDALDILNDICALAIDQENGNDQDILNRLNKAGINGLPETIDSFDNRHSYLHRNYTHRGWNFYYEEDDAHWNDIRKNMMLTTVNQVFDFGFWSGKNILGYRMGYDEQCDAFAELIYYVHIIGDHIQNTSYHANYLEIPLIKGNGKYGIIEDLLDCSKLLFADQTDDRAYKDYINDLTQLKSDISKIYTSPSSLNGNPETYQKYHAYAEDLMNCLIKYIPLLLQKEQFFSDVFYSINSKAAFVTSPDRLVTFYFS